MSRRARLQWRHSRRVGGARARPSTVWNGAGSGMVQLAPPQSSNIGYNRTASDWEKTMHAIGLVLLGIAIMALLLTDADAQRRSSAQGSQAAGAKGSWCAVHPRTAARTAAIRRSINAGRRQGRKAAGAAPIHFRARHTGPAIPGQVRSARTAAGLTDRRARPQQEGVSNEDASCCRHSCDGDRSPRSGEGEAGAIGAPPARLSVVGATRLLPWLPSE